MVGEAPSEPRRGDAEPCPRNVGVKVHAEPAGRRCGSDGASPSKCVPHHANEMPKARNKLFALVPGAGVLS